MATAIPPIRLLVYGIRQLWTGSHVIDDAALLLAEGRVAWVGRAAEAPPGQHDVYDAGGAIGMPGLVDPHTHTTFAGSRARDFERRLAGETYTAILEAGGGIHSTVAATRAASEDDLVALTRDRLAGMLALGVTTVEIKSGYGLTAADEAKMLRAARRAAGPVDVVTTFLGAHARPPGVPDYVDRVIDEQLPVCAPLADAIDAYCDRGAFTLAETERILRAGMAYGLAVRVHAEQVVHTGAAALAASLGALSADHLERIDDEGIEAMARAGTVAVLLPGAMAYLKDPAPPVARFRAAGVPMAIGTDFNPGSSPVRDLWACATLACLTMGLTVSEALAGITTHAARAVGRPDRGWLGPGARADLALYDPPPGEPAELRVLVQYLGGHRAKAVFKDGRRVI
ncbi:MAG: imidazolonepropionase [Pseudomonadota bacterium]|nr:imidazolonepropionase [Pseudomonadota bacterium]